MRATAGGYVSCDASSMSPRLRPAFVCLLALAACGDDPQPDDAAPAGSSTSVSVAASTSADVAAASTGAGDGGAAGAPGTGGSGGAGGDVGFYGPSRCDTSGLQLCDGFESGEIDMATWTKNVTPGTTLAVDSVHAARGTYALHVHADKAGKMNGYIKETVTFPAAKNSFYGRAFAYVEKDVPTNNFNYFSASGPGSTYNLGGTTAPFGSADGTHFIRFNYQPLDVVSKSAIEVPVDGWNCWEWYFKGDDPNELHFWLDEVEVPDMTVVGGTSQGQWVAPEFGTMAFGFHHAHDEPTGYDVWIDEVAVDPARIGCKL